MVRILSALSVSSLDNLPVTDETLIKARELLSFQKPSERDYRSVKNWIWNLKPLVGREQAFINHKEDILTLHNGREWSWFDGLVEWLLLKLDCKLVRVGCLDVGNYYPFQLTSASGFF